MIRRSLPVLAALALFACKTPETKPDEKPAAPPPAAAAPAAPEKTPAETAAAEYKAQGQAELDKALDKLKNVRVFFEFDSANLSKEASERLAEVGEVLARHPELDVRIEGNADERGSSQYNLALGQKRADSVKKYLAQLGVKEGQIKAISFGAEKPIDPGHDEEAWKKNRRADLQATPEPAAKEPAKADPAKK